MVSAERTAGHGAGRVDPRWPRRRPGSPATRAARANPTARSGRAEASTIGRPEGTPSRGAGRRANGRGTHAPRTPGDLGDDWAVASKHLRAMSLLGGFPAAREVPGCRSVDPVRRPRPFTAA